MITQLALYGSKFLRTSILPSLPLICPNAVCTVEIWSLMKSYQTTTHWRLYRERKAVYKKSKDIMKRLSNKTIDSLSGTVGKLAHSNPIIFINAVNQIVSYDNLRTIVIQAPIRHEHRLRPSGIHRPGHSRQSLPSPCQER